MKTTLTKIALLGIAGAIAFALCSFKISMPPVKPTPATVLEDDWAEWNKVRAFIKEHISNPIAEKQSGDAKKAKMEYYSRCPSGYNSNIAGKREVVKTNCDVFGTIVFYKGCSPKHICDFKVCVDKNIALVKSKNAEEYMPVKEWLEQNSKVAVSTPGSVKS